MARNGLSKCALFDQIVWRAVSWLISDLVLGICFNSCSFQAVLDGSYRFYPSLRCYLCFLHSITLLYIFTLC
jgi:hypothetical protein